MSGGNEFYSLLMILIKELKIIIPLFSSLSNSIFFLSQDKKYKGILDITSLKVQFISSITYPLPFPTL